MQLDISLTEYIYGFLWRGHSVLLRLSTQYTRIKGVITQDFHFTWHVTYKIHSLRTSAHWRGHTGVRKYKNV